MHWAANGNWQTESMRLTDRNRKKNMAWEYAIFGREAEDHGGVKMPLPTHCRSGVASVGNDGLTAWIRHQSWSDSQNMAQIICEIIFKRISSLFRASP